jgi:hypothetical protein
MMDFVDSTISFTASFTYSLLIVLSKSHNDYES